MEYLASLFVTLVLFTNSLAPKANLQQILGVDLETPAVLSDETTSDRAVVEDQEEVVETDTASPEATARFGKETRKNSLEQTREKRRAELEKAKEAHKARIESMQQKREEFKEKLKEIKNERRQKAIERIDANLVKHNEKWVEHWNKVLSRLSEILAKIKMRVEKMAAEGRDTSAVNAAISVAEAAIASAQEAINNQAGKSYILNIGEEETLGENVSALVQQFKQDVRGVVDKVKAARQAVHDAFKALKILVKPGVETEVESE